MPGATNTTDLLITALDTAGIGNLYPGAPSATGLQLWLRSDRGVTSSNGRVSLWADQSSNGRNATMATASRQPTLAASALAGRPVVRFGGAQSMNLTSLQPNQFTIFVVGKNSRSSESFSMILGPGGNWPNNQLRWENGTQALFVGTGNGLPTIHSTIGNTRTYHALSARYDGATMSVFRDATRSPATTS